jgi:hypothetical protein
MYPALTILPLVLLEFEIDTSNFNDLNVLVILFNRTRWPGVTLKPIRSPNMI